MEYIPFSCVWEITMGCNMRCGHCGSSCSEPLPDELSTAEALGLIDQFAEVGLRKVTLSGGEPTLRRDISQLIRHLKQHKISVNLITNGWNMDSALAAMLKADGIYTVAVSLDGTEEIHDHIRRTGAYSRVQNALAVLKQAGIKTGVITTVTKQNITALPALRDALIAMGADVWQVQIGLPMGNLAKRPDWVIAPDEVGGLLDFCYETAVEGKISVYPADCIGYYTEKELLIKRINYPGKKVSVWNGCGAGVRGFGVLHNGDVLGCTSIRDREYIEGNIRTTRLYDIWNNPDSFAWRRTLKADDLTGDCKTCTYGKRCLGGCANTRLTMSGAIHAENLYCVYNTAVKQRREALTERNDIQGLLREARQRAKDGACQDAELLIDRILALSPLEVDAMALRGYTAYQRGDYVLCEAVNRDILAKHPDYAYAMQGLGLALSKRGYVAEAVAWLEKAAETTHWKNKDILHDLKAVKNDG